MASESKYINGTYIVCTKSPTFFITFQLAVDKYTEEIQWHQMSFKSATIDDKQTVDWQFNLSFRRI